MTEIMFWVAAALLYLLCGQIFSLCYMFAYRPDTGTAMLGVMGLFWIFILLFDLIMSVAGGFGKVTKKFWVRANM